MSWEKRGNAKYYYRKKKVDGRVVARYVGGESSDITRCLAAVDEAERRLRAYRLRFERGRREAFDDADAAVRDWCKAVAAIVAAAMEEKGYHRHERGEWRKRRMSEPTDTLPVVPAEGGEPTKGGRPTAAELAPLVERAGKGDDAATKELLRVLEDDPDRLIRLGHGKMDESIEAVWVYCNFKKNPLRRQAVLARMEQLRVELAGPHPSPLERLLVERVVMCWFKMQVYELVEAAPDTFGVEQWQRRTERAQRSYLAAIKALAQVRQLELPATQVNVAMAGGQQVNVQAT
jgi:hypothetical protein